MYSNKSTKTYKVQDHLRLCADSATGTKRRTRGKCKKNCRLVRNSTFDTYVWYAQVSRVATQSLPPHLVEECLKRLLRYALTTLLDVYRYLLDDNFLLNINN